MSIVYAQNVFIYLVAARRIFSSVIIMKFKL